MIGSQEQIRRREVAQNTVLDVRGHVLRGLHRRVEQSPIAQTPITTVPVDLIRVDGDNLLDSQEVDVATHFASFLSVEA